MSWLPASMLRLAECESTNDEALRLAQAGAPHGAVVVAERQSAGRGRRGREWASVPGNLYMSIVLRPELALDQVASITLAAGIAVAEAVNSFVPGASLKWPNDVLLRQKKVAGILCEMSSQGGRIESLILGIGVNVGQREFPGELSKIATSIALASDDELETRVFETRLLSSLDKWLTSYLSAGVSAVAPRWQELAAFTGREVRVGEIQGTQLGLDKRGGLVIEDASGHHHHVSAGEVIPV